MIERLSMFVSEYMVITQTMGLLLYWVPLSFCAYGYTIRTWVNYQKDVAARAFAETPGNVNAPTYLQKEYYHPTDTVGTLIGRALITIMPVANLWASVFDLAPKVFGSLFKWVGRVFDQPLVPKRGGK